MLINIHDEKLIYDAVRDMTAVVLLDIREVINVSNKILKHVQNAMVTVDSEVTISAGVMEVEDDASFDDCYRLAESL